MYTPDAQLPRPPPRVHLGSVGGHMHRLQMGSGPQTTVGQPSSGDRTTGSGRRGFEARCALTSTTVPERGYSTNPNNGLSGGRCSIRSGEASIRLSSGS